MPDVDTALRHFRKARQHIDAAEAALRADDPTARKVLDAVAGETPLVAIQRATGLNYDAAAKACSRLVRRGDLRRVRLGVYARPSGAGEGGR